MAFYKHQYMHQTVEHCMKQPTPSNVSLAYSDRNTMVYTVDLPASVWMAVRINVHDHYDYERVPFPSAALRQEWIDNYISSRRVTIP